MFFIDTPFSSWQDDPYNHNLHRVQFTTHPAELRRFLL